MCIVWVSPRVCVFINKICLRMQDFKSKTMHKNLEFEGSISAKMPFSLVMPDLFAYW